MKRAFGVRDGRSRCSPSATVRLTVVVIASVLASSCTSRSHGADGSPTAPGSLRGPQNAPHELVAVQRRDIEPAELVTATVVAGPTVAIRAQNGGTLAVLVEVGDLTEPGDQIATVDGKRVDAPVGGHIGFTMIDGVVVDSGLPLVSIHTGHFALVADGSTTLDTETVAGAVGGSTSIQAQVTDLSRPFSCDVLTTAPPTSGDSPAASPSLVCLLPPELAGRVVEGLSGVISIGLSLSSNVLALPITAVAGRDATGQVALQRDDGTFELVDVTLGASDGSWIEVEGLEEGDQVSGLAPNLWW